MKRLTDSQKALRHDFPRGKSIVLLGASAGTVRGHKGNFVRVLLEGPACYGLALALRTELTE